MWHDIRFAARLLMKERASSLVAVITLAVGMSATITMFTIVHGVYLRDLPFEHPDRIVSIGTRRLAGGPNALDNLSFPDLQDLRASARLFDGIAAADEETMDLADDDNVAERFVGAWVSAGAFGLLGHRPALGRGFTAADDRPDADPVVILGDRVWKRRYGGREDIVGGRIRINGLASTVVGVMPEGFGFPHQSDLWQPLALRADAARGDRGARNIDAFGRMAAGVTIAQAEADLAGVMERLAREFPESNADVGALVRPFRDLTTRGPIQIVFTGLMGAVSMLLLIACANVGNLLLARGATRGREIAVRLSLGATRRQVVRQLLAEALLLAGVAGTAGLALGALGVRAFLTGVAGTGAPYWVRVPIDGQIFAFVAAICLGTTVVCGLAPALHASQAGLAGILVDAGRGTVSTARARRWADGFVIAQLALSLTMLAAAGLFMQNVYAFSRLAAGADLSGLVAAPFALPARRYPGDEERRTFYRQLEERLASLPGMQAGITSATPLRGAARRGVSIDARAPAGNAVPVVSTATIGAGYLETLGIAPLRGRLFTPADGAAARVAVVNERFAELLFPGQEAVGRTVRLEPAAPQAAPGDALTIVGVVPNVRQASPRQETVDARRAEPVLYASYAATPLPSATIVVRSSAGPGAVAVALRDALRALDPDLPITGGVMPLTEATEQELGLLTVFGGMFGLFAAAALGLATVGLYGVTAHAMAQRTREIGVRLALGARARHVWWLVSRRATGQLAVGLALGLAGALGAGQLLQGVLTAVSGRDPLTLSGVSVLMAVVVFVACLIPAARALRLDPVAALRAE